MRNVSFFHTQAQYRARTKTETRRQWKKLWIPAGVQFMGVVKGQGIPAGQKIERIHPSTVLETCWQHIDMISPESVIAEGFPEWSPEQFVEFYCDMNKAYHKQLCARLVFKHDKEIEK
jgi:hypothetical protein